MLKKDPFTTKEAQLAGLIKKYIADNNMKSGDQLPSVRKLTTLFSTSKNTVTAALEDLSYQGIVHIKSRYGTFVSSHSWQENKMLDWDNIWRKTSYLPTESLLWNVMSGIEHAQGIYNVSLMNISDNIYTDILKKASDSLMKTISTSNTMDVSHFSGLHELKEALCGFMTRYGMKTDPRQIFFTTSVSEAVPFVSRLIVRKNSTVLYEAPSITNIRSHFRALGAHMQPVETDENGIREDALLKYINKNKNSFLFTYPVYNVPDGSTVPEGRKMSIQNMCLNADVPIIEIDTYRMLDFDGDAPPTYYTYSNGNGVIYIGSLGSIFPFSFSLSWVVLPYHLIKAANDIYFQQNGPKNNNIYVQMLVNEMFRSGIIYKYLDDVKKHIAYRYEQTKPIINKYFGDIAEICDKHPQVYWLKFPFSCKPLLKYDHIMRSVLGECFSSKCNNCVMISKVNPNMDEYEAGIAKLRELIDSIM